MDQGASGGAQSDLGAYQASVNLDRSGKASFVALLPATLAKENDRDGLYHDFQVLPETRVANILQVELHLALDILETGVVLLAHLRQAGDTGTGALPQPVVRNGFPKLREDRDVILRMWDEEVLPW